MRFAPSEQLNANLVRLHQFFDYFVVTQGDSLVLPVEGSVNACSLELRLQYKKIAHSPLNFVQSVQALMAVQILSFKITLDYENVLINQTETVRIVEFLFL